MSFMMRLCSWWLLLLLIAGLTLSACQTVGVGWAKVLVKDAQSDELKKETTTLGVTLPPGCTTITTSTPAGKKLLTVSYQEPTIDHGNGPLAFTTIYLSSPGGQAQVIRVWTNDARGGATVTIKNVAAPAQEFAICVTATNWARQESPPALLTLSAQ